MDHCLMSPPSCVSIYSSRTISLYLKVMPQVIKLVSCSTKVSMKFIMLINVKMPTIVGIYMYKHDKYNICEFESKKSSISAF